METSGTLVDLIDQIVKEKTFSLDALSAIENLKRAAEDSQKKLESTLSLLEKAREEINAAKGALGAIEVEKQRLAAKEAAITTREKETTALERKAAVAEAVSFAQKEMISLVFRNIDTRNVMFGNAISTVGNPPYTTSTPFTETTETTKL